MKQPTLELIKTTARRRYVDLQDLPDPKGTGGYVSDSGKPLFNP